MWKRNLLLRCCHRVGDPSTSLKEGIGSFVSIRTQACAAGARMSLDRAVALLVIPNSPDSPIPVGYGSRHGSKPI